ncbi:MAG: hypothetical protein HYZ75_07305 [Elusimicrobia bacterium]|nr:hypothetical protein [Elusimicrobiota bacterium]
MEDEPIEPEVMGRSRARVSFKTISAPWALLGVGALGIAGVSAVLALCFGWLFVLAFVYRWLWNHAVGPDATRLVYGAETLGYGRALASVALLALVGWLVSPKRS